MERKIRKKLLEWKSDTRGKALLLEGCRQIGKTYTLTEFGQEEYSKCLYLNFETDPKYASIFHKGRSAESIYAELSMYGFVPSEDGTTLLILDEVQSCPEAFSALKPLAIDGRCHIAASGSLLGLHIGSDLLSPIGYVKIIDMHPMDFEEFLWANGIGHDVTDGIRSHIRGMMPMSESMLSAVNELYRTFLIIGGMPDAVKTYVETKDYSRVAEVQRNIVRMFRSDSMKYSSAADRLKISACMDSVPVQLTKENKVFGYYDIEKIRGSGSRQYGNSILWLKDAGIVNMVSNVTEPTEPLASNVRSGSFKLYMADTGILMSMLGETVSGGTVNDAFHVNRGGIEENSVADALVSLGYRPFFYQKRNSSLEIDFLIDAGEGVIAVEVKSGNYRQCKSLRELMSDRYKVPFGIMVSDSNVFTDEEGVKHYPLFGPWFFPEASVPEVDYPKDAIELLKNASIG